MPLPPERISVKRRRQEEPVEALYLQEINIHNQKRRFTDYYFKLLRDDSIAPQSSNPSRIQAPQPSSNPSSAFGSSGVPIVRATAPGDEIEDFRKLRAAQKVRREGSEISEPLTQPERAAKDAGHTLTQSRTPSVNFLQHARRFHLTRTLSSFYRPDSSGGIRKPRSKILPPLPTFIERQSAVLPGQGLHIRPPVDRILNSRPEKAKAKQDGDVEAAQVSETTTTFVKPSTPKKKLGSSINDHPSTWDVESDQLADELAALAMEIEPVSRTLSPQNRTRPIETSYPDAKLNVQMRNDDFVLETYIRVPHEASPISHRALEPNGANFGVLVIDEEDEELWQHYMEGEDDDSDWDEEDSNAEDNPAHDYPEDEVSSEDEFDRGAYNYRRNASDDERYGEDEYD